ncbi:hypothetical protein ACIHAR_30700 [Streptomyces sp. NPDC052016]|uniref:hypothetical protein n=1 Tax=Streptomyces sp. NPDC052016 TaxID=3365680 RepID=UPI0037D836EB
MPRGRHRHSPPLHRLLPPSAIAGVSLVCALGPWVFTEPMVLRGLAAAAAVTAVLGAVVMRRWDIQAGKQVADLTRARASDEWRFEERVAELESDLDESRELRVKLEQRLRAKRAELAGLRNEHAALLRRYATAETERASALEGRRLLEIETTAPARALPPAPRAEEAPGTGAGTAAVREGTPAGTDETETPANDTPETATTEAGETTEISADVEAGATANPSTDVEAAADEPKAPAAFSPAGSQLFLRAQAALARFDGDAVQQPAEPSAPSAPSAQVPDSDDPAAQAEPGRAARAQTGGDAEAAREDEVEGKPEAVDEHTRAAAPQTAAGENENPAEQAAAEEAARSEKAEDKAEGKTEDAGTDAGTPEEPDATHSPEAGQSAVSLEAERSVAPRADTTDTTGAPAVDAGALVPRPGGPVPRPSGHFTVPTAVAVVPAAQPVRRPAAEGGFDFFGTKRTSASDALEAVQNEDLADVVGQEALALHKAESEAEFKPADEEARGVGQVIDLTAHDETEQIDVHGLRSAAS